MKTEEMILRRCGGLTAEAVRRLTGRADGMANEPRRVMEVRVTVADWKTGARAPGFKRIVGEVSAETGVPEELLMARTRVKWVAHARWRIFHRARTELGWSLHQIAGVWGLDHATVIHGLRRVGRSEPEVRHG